MYPPSVHNTAHDTLAPAIKMEQPIPRVSMQPNITCAFSPVLPVLPCAPVTALPGRLV